VRLDGQEESGNVEDQRSGGGLPGGMITGGGLGTIVVFVVLALLGVDPRQLMQQLPAQPAAPMQQGGGAAPPAAQEPLRHFVAVVLRDTEIVWEDLFRQQGMAYRDPKLVLFTGRVDSACGLASSAVGPFYCPGDERVYLDLDFYNEMRTRFGVKGDFAQAYVVAHEVGHHVQNLLGVSKQVEAKQQRAGKVEANQLSVRLELQADFYAGVWAHHAQERFNFLEQGDIESALNCAQAIGDDRLQQQARGGVVPDSFTHGTSAQRMKWFKRGFDTGDMSQGDTFGVPYDSL
jgi:predicted metalloprotease